MDLIDFNQSKPSNLGEPPVHTITLSNNNFCPFT